mgnify:CR=1 FL=1
MQYFILYIFLSFIIVDLNFNKICGHLTEKKWKKVWQDDQKVPFIFQGNTFIGYDDIESIEAKVIHKNEN